MVHSEGGSEFPLKADRIRRYGRKENRTLYKKTAGGSSYGHKMKKTSIKGVMGSIIHQIYAPQNVFHFENSYLMR